MIDLQLKKNEFKQKCQRFQRGYSNYDASEIDEWFITMILPMLKQFKKRGIYESEIDSDLSEMIDCFEEVRKAVFNLFIWDTEYKQMTQAEKDLYDPEVVCKKKYDRAFELFHKRFLSLSD